jgi:predicted PhzF superfamily epimerase YddE/YHI9
MVATTGTDDKLLPEMTFYMPSGDAVSFCAHAALGGASAVAAAETKQFSFRSNMTGERQVVHFPKDEQEDGMPCLYMQAPFEEAPVSHSPSLQRLLREHLHVSSQQLIPRLSHLPPTFVNSSVARPKTLVHINTLEDLGQAKAPIVASSNSQQKRTSFATACGAIDESTGIYLYAYRDDEDGAAWECRQFPRSSGYPEDPATGIAAAALAASFYQHNIRLPVYKFYQGTAMGRPSLIQVVELEMKGDTVSFGLQGRVEIDDRDTIEVDDN